MNLKGLEEFLEKSLKEYNCAADSEVLSDYIVALIENGTRTPEDFCDQLKVFLHGSTEAFSQDLSNFIAQNLEEEDSCGEGSCSSNEEKEEEEEEEVDYEELNEMEPVSIIKRPLREYSPERRPEASEAPSKKPCTNYSKYGNCRFGDNCRYAHIPRRRNLPSKLILKNVPASLQDTKALTEMMSVYGMVINVTVYPEDRNCSVQFSSAEEASKAFEEAGEKLDQDVVLELESNHKNSSQARFKKVDDSSVKLESLLNLQKQQQSLLETNLSTQQSLLNHLQNPSTSAEERAELFETLKKIQESVTGIQEMLKKTTEMILEISNSKKKFSHQHTAANTVSHRNKQYPRFNDNHQQYQNRYNAKPASYSKAFNKPMSIKSGSLALDLRPTTLKLGPLNRTEYPDMRALQRQFAPFGMIQSLILSDGGQSAVIKYQKADDARRAFDKVSKDLESVDGVEFAFIKPDIINKE